MSLNAGLHDGNYLVTVAAENSGDVAASREPIEFESVRTEESLAGRIYRPFFTAGIATILSLGCVWGAINLLTIGVKQNFNAVNYSWVLAHAHATVFGFVGLFIMGFAYQALPRFRETSLWQPKFALASLPLMIVGILIQTVAHLLEPPSLLLVVLASVIQLLAIVIFAVVITKTFRKSGTQVYDRFVYSALGWFLLAAIANPIIFKLFELPGSRQQLLFNLATFNIPYRDVEILGIAVVMILGVSLHLLPQLYGFREPSVGWRAFLFWGLNASILCGVITFIVGMVLHNTWLLLTQWLATVVLLVIAVGTQMQFRLFARPKRADDRSLKFIRAAYVWFVIGSAMLVMVPLYNFLIYMPLTGSAVPFSHAFFGAYRHALTVGFVSMMIVGVSSRAVPLFLGATLSKTGSLWATFVLLNIGNALRVASQIATDFTPRAYSIMGVSGLIEVIALALWSYELVRNMRAANIRRKGMPATAPAFGPT